MRARSVDGGQTMQSVRMLAAASAIALAAMPATAQDAARGKALADPCLACHTFNAADEPGPGPTLAGIAGAKAGTRPDFEYSDAFQAANARGVVWTDAALNRFLADGQKEVQRNKMAYPGIANESERLDIIAFLKTLK